MSKVTRCIKSSSRNLAALALAMSVAGCGEPVPLTEPETPRQSASGSPIDFSFETADGGRLRGVDLRGRLTVLAFVSTFDFSSQAQVKVLTNVLRDHKPRVNVAAIVLEPPENKPLVINFGKSLGLPYPVAIGDERTVQGRGPFEGLHRVPSILILDRDGREAFRHTGPMDARPLHVELDKIARR